MSTSFCWELTSNGLDFCTGGVKTSHLLNTMEKGDKHQLKRAIWLGKGFHFYNDDAVYIDVSHSKFFSIPATLLMIGLTVKTGTYEEGKAY